MASTVARDWIGFAASDSSNPHLNNKEVHNLLEQSRNLYEKKLWHQLTTAIESFVSLPYWNTTKDEKLMVGLYEKFIKDFETKMNQLKLVKICLAIVNHISNPNESANFLQRLVDRINPQAEKEAFALALSEIAHIKLAKLNQPEESRLIAEKASAALEGMTGADPFVYSSYYRYLALYYKMKVVPTDFYKNCLMYLVYTPLETVALTEQQALAFDMGIAAVVSNDIYNFGELLAHPILKSLQGTKGEWLVHFLYAFNSGQIDTFEKFLQHNKAEIDSQPILQSNLVLLRQKISVLALMELVFNKSADERTLPFKAIADATKLPIDEVELLVMKALSLKLIKGEIDELSQTVTITWVQPRVLDMNQVAKMKDRVQKWIDTTHQVLSFLESSTAPELFT